MNSEKTRRVVVLVIVSALLRSDPPAFFIPPWGRFRRLARRRARELCIAGVPCRAAARQAIREIAEEDARILRAVAFDSAGYWSQQRGLDRDDLTQDAFMSMFPRFATNYSPPTNFDEDEHSRCLRKYVFGAVRYTAHQQLRRGDPRPLQSDALEQIEHDVDLFSEYAREEFDEFLWTLPAEERRRLSAIRNCRTIAEAARDLGMPADTLRHWFYNFCLRHRSRG